MPPFEPAVEPRKPESSRWKPAPKWIRQICRRTVGKKRATLFIAKPSTEPEEVAARELYSPARQEGSSARAEFRPSYTGVARTSTFSPFQQHRRA